jgi:Predicted nucleic acid-binding protein, contains PIN domain
VIVVDVNVIVYLLTDTPQRELALGLRKWDGDWFVPPLWRHEFLNVLASLTRQAYLNETEALTLWRNALGLFGQREQQPDMEKALSLAIRHGVSAYDAQYVALAEALGVLLISEDKKLQSAFPQRVISLAQARERSFRGEQ